ncbi:ankyrin repeat domain-containing protein 50-like [Haliotis asinina]|uniref:ankyrin repeat domain-containing protein 50-like n=1 Tax=Haliotis asinina TaxID=109174 RepID=UPI0035321310
MPLHDACSKGELERVKRIICGDLVEVNIRDKRNGRTPLMVAAKKGRKEVVDFLMSVGASVSQADDEGNTILDWACKGGHVDIVKRLVSEYSVDVNRKTKTGQTPLMTVALLGHRDMFDVLVSEGADVYQVDNDDFSILHWACRGGHVDMVKHIVAKYSADINRKAKRGEVPLMTAAYNGHSDVVDFLVNKGADVSQLDDNDCNVLHWACRGGHVGMVKHLVSEYTVDVNGKAKMGKVPLMTAAYFGDRDVFDVLVSVGANVSQIDDNGDSILRWACAGGHVNMVKHLVSEYRLDVNRKGKSGKTPLIIAAQRGWRNVFKVLVSGGASVSEVDDDGDNILHYASIWGRTKMVQHIISEHLVDINGRGRYQRTPLMRAASHGRGKVFGILVKNGAVRHLVDDQGLNILHLACLGGHVEMVKNILSQNMVDLNATDKDGDTAAKIAKRSGKLEVYDILVSWRRTVK